MSHNWIHVLAFCLLCSILSVGSDVVAQLQEETSSDLATTETAVEKSSKNDETNTDTDKEAPAKSEELIEKEAVKENKTSELLIVVQQDDINGLKIKNARVMVTLDTGKEYGFRTNEAGEVRFLDLPYGRIDIDVTSSGRKSAAEKLVLDNPQETLTIKLVLRTIEE